MGEVYKSSNIVAGGNVRWDNQLTYIGYIYNINLQSKLIFMERKQEHAEGNERSDGSTDIFGVDLEALPTEAIYKMLKSTMDGYDKGLKELHEGRCEGRYPTHPLRPRTVGK